MIFKDPSCCPGEKWFYPSTNERGRPGGGTAVVWTRAVAVEVSNSGDTSEDLLMAKTCDVQEQGFGLSKWADGSIS